MSTTENLTPRSPLPDARLGSLGEGEFPDSPFSHGVGERGRGIGGRILRLTVEYDGTDFAGFQWQGGGQRTVQGALEAAIERASGAFSRVHGAGRTDAGVHALGQVVHFRTEWKVPADKAAVALNTTGRLARDVVVRESAEAEPGFHARYSATSRMYRYVVLNRPQPSAMLGRYALHLRDPLDIGAMRASARELTGIHDWATFGHPAKPGRSTVRRVDRVDIRPWKDTVLITVRGNAFLRQQVRSFVGTLLLAGQGKLTPGEIAALREERDRTRCPSVAPPQGLCLVRVDYTGVRHTYTIDNDELNDLDDSDESPEFDGADDEIDEQETES